MSPHDELIARAKAVRIEDVIASRGIRLSAGRAERCGACPQCGGKDRFSINTTKQVFNCRGCRAHGDVIDLVRHLDRVDFETAIATLVQKKPNGDATALEEKIKWPEPPVCAAAAQVYHFRDPVTCVVVYRKERYESNGTKTFRIIPAGRNGSAPMLYGAERLADLGESQAVWIVEGENKVDRLRELGAVAVSGDSGASSKWLPEHARLLCDLPIILWPDSDAPGELYITNAAAAVLSISPRADICVARPFGPPDGTKGRDVCDWTGDLDALAAAATPFVTKPTDDAGAPPKKPGMIIEWFTEAAESALNEPWKELVGGVLDEGGLSVIYGDSGSGKTFAALDIGFHIGTALTWNGRKVNLGLVIYVAAEGGKRIKFRIAALQKRYRENYGGTAPDPLFALIRYPIDLRSSDADLNSLIALVKVAEKKAGCACAWLIVDTLSRAMAGGDENSPVDMGRIVAAADRLRAELGAHFTFVHHSGKDAARGARGHSLLRAATDTELETTDSSLTLTKQRDGELGFKIGFQLVDVEIGQDADGKCIKSAVVEWKAASAEKTKNKRETAPSHRLLMTVIDAAIDEAGFQFMPWADGPVVRAVRDEIARARYYARIAEPQDDKDWEKSTGRKRQAWHRTVKAALDAKELGAAERDNERVLWKL